MTSQNLHSLFQNAQSNGLSRQSVDLLVQNLDGQTGLGCVGAQVDDLNTDDVTLLAVLLDESGSMDSVRNDVIDAFNQMMRALHDSKAKDSILVSAWKFANSPSLLFNYTPIDNVKDLTAQDYTPNGGTALYDATMDSFTGIVGYGQDLRNNGIRTRCIVVVVTDGGDNSSGHSAASVRTVALDLLRQEYYSLAFVGFGDEPMFTQIAQAMGFPSLMTAGTGAKEIRKALNLVSGSIIKASQAKIQPTGNNFFTP
ncbi:MAG TPA: vWA domain-containing protein [Aggregatilineales bacterium]|nr:VWA domain-containing protein [Anaerolineales bacterium]HRE47569.1 vWA domain-containing protein [Aggregatilineales bacterium]